jgi:dephospho-CoA kinase
MIIGVTGPSGAGKGTVSAMLRAHGFIHIDTDIVAREVADEVLPKLTEEFGTDILQPDGTLDRAALAKKAFSSDECTKVLNGIMHGAIMNRVREMIDKEQQKGHGRFVIDGAALFEAHGNEMCDYVIAVLCDEKNRLSRIISRDGITEEQAKQRFSRQLSDVYFRENSDFIIVNDNLKDTKKQLFEILNTIYGGTK